METVTISKKEYQELLEAKARIQILKKTMTEDLFSPPPTRDATTIVSEMRKTGKYSDTFIESLHRGMERSAYFKRSKK